MTDNLHQLLNEAHEPAGLLAETTKTEFTISQTEAASCQALHSESVHYGRTVRSWEKWACIP